MNPRTSSGTRTVQPSPARLEWLQLKAEAEREAKEASRAAPLAAAAEQTSQPDHRSGTRIWRETRRALAEIRRNRRRWEAY